MTERAPSRNHRPEPDLIEDDSRGQGEGRSGRRLLVRRCAAFGVAAIVMLSIALSGGGYDAAFRQQAAMVVWAAIALGLAFGVLPRGRAMPVSALALLGLAGLTVTTGLALAWTESDERTFEELARVAGYSGFVVLPYLALSKYTSRAAAAGLGSAVLLIPVLAVIRALAPDLLSDDATQLLGRLSYPLGYWNGLACLCAMALAIGLVWSAHARDLRVRCGIVALLPWAGLALYLTYSRAGAVSVVVALLAALALSRARWTVAAHSAIVGASSALAIAVARSQPEIESLTGSAGAGSVLFALIAGGLACAGVAAAAHRFGFDRVRLPRPVARASLAAALAVVVLAALTVARPALEEGWDEFRNENTPVESSDPSTRLTSFGGYRYAIWDATLDAFSSAPAKGIGPGSFEFWWAREGSEVGFLRDGHSLYLETLAELGVFGFGFLVLALGALLAAALAARRRIVRRDDFGACSAMIAGFIVFLVYAGVDWVWEVPALVVVGLGGIAIAGSAGASRWGNRSMPNTARLAAVGLALAAFAVQIPGLVSVERLRASVTELQNENPDLALELADDSVRAAPFAASPYVQRGLAKQAQGDLAGAREDLGEAIIREPTNWRHHALMAAVAARLGDRRALDRELAEARRLSPRSAFLVPGSSFVNQVEALLKKAG